MDLIYQQRLYQRHLSLTGKGNKGNHFVNFPMAQSKHDLHQSSTRLMKIFVHTKMGTGDIIMHIR